MNTIGMGSQNVNVMAGGENKSCIISGENGGNKEIYSKSAENSKPIGEELKAFAAKIKADAKDFVGKTGSIMSDENAEATSDAVPYLGVQAAGLLGTVIGGILGGHKRGHNVTPSKAHEAQPAKNTPPKVNNAQESSTPFVSDGSMANTKEGVRLASYYLDICQFAGNDALEGRKLDQGFQKIIDSPDTNNTEKFLAKFGLNGVKNPNLCERDNHLNVKRKHRMMENFTRPIRTFSKVVADNALMMDDCVETSDTIDIMVNGFNTILESSIANDSNMVMAKLGLQEAQRKIEPPKYEIREKDEADIDLEEAFGTSDPFGTSEESIEKSKYESKLSNVAWLATAFMKEISKSYTNRPVDLVALCCREISESAPDDWGTDICANGLKTILEYPEASESEKDLAKMGMEILEEGLGGNDYKAGEAARAILLRIHELPEPTDKASATQS